MDYWESNLWLFVLCLWIAFLIFSPDRKSAKISAIWLLSYCFVAPAIDRIFPLVDNQQSIQTICGLIGAVASYRAFKAGLPTLSKVFAAAAICHFIYFVVLIAGKNIDSIFFITFYSIEVIVVFCSMGVANHANRTCNTGGCGVGGRFHVDRGDNQ